MRNIRCRRLLTALVALSILVAEVPSYVNANPSTLDKINQKKEEKKQTEGKRDEAADNVNQMNNQKNQLMGELNNLNSQLTEIGDNLANLEAAMDEKKQEIEETQQDLEEARAVEEEQYAMMKKRLQFIYERGDVSYLELLLEASSFGDFLNKNQYIEMLNQYDHRKLEEYKETKEYIISVEAKLEDEKTELDEMIAQTKEEQGKVSILVSNTASSVTSYSNQIAQTQAEISLYEEQIKQQEADLAALIAQYQRELELSRLAQQSAWRDISEVTFEENDRFLLANLIYCEAGGEPYAGQLAVGAVVINRVLSSRYPNTVVGVIYQNRQFQPVTTGRFALAIASDKATASCYQAADEAMKGITNVGNCVYFRTPIEGLEGIRIGGHIFY